MLRAALAAVVTALVALAAFGVSAVAHAPSAVAAGESTSWLAISTIPGGLVGGSNAFYQATAGQPFSASGTDGGVVVNTGSPESFSMLFSPGRGAILAPGRYQNSMGFSDGIAPEMMVTSPEYGCSADTGPTGEYDVEDIAFANGAVSRLDIAFRFQCEGGPAYSTGEISYNEPSAGPLALEAGHLLLEPQYPGVANAAMLINVVNTTALPAPVASPVATGRDPGDITVTANNCPLLLAGGATCTISVTATPGGVGDRQTGIAVASGLAVATALLADPGRPGNAAFVIDTTTTAGVTGGQQLTLNQLNAAFLVGGGGSSVAVAAKFGNSTVYASFGSASGPSLTPGTYTATLPASPTAPPPFSLNISGTVGDITISCRVGTATGRVVVDQVVMDQYGGLTQLAAEMEQDCPGEPRVFVTLRWQSSLGYSAIGVQPANDQLGFPSLFPGSVSPAETVTYTNTGVVPLMMARPALTGANPADFLITGSTCTGAPIPPKGTCRVALVFTPTAFGARTASLVDADNTWTSTHTVTISGVGASAPTFTNPVDGQASADVYNKPMTWPSSAQAQAYLVVGGSKLGIADLFNSGILPPSQTTYYPPAIAPFTPVYATLFTEANGHWSLYSTISFTIAVPAAHFTNPTLGGTSFDANKPITWTAAPKASGYVLEIGTPGYGNNVLFKELPAGQTSFPLPALPSNTALTATIVTVWPGPWQNASTVDFVYKATQATFTYPLNGQMRVNQLITVNWDTAPTAQAYILVLGTTPGTADLLNTGLLPPTKSSYDVVLPLGRTIYATIFTQIGGYWLYQQISFQTLIIAGR